MLSLMPPLYFRYATLSFSLRHTLIFYAAIDTPHYSPMPLCFAFIRYFAFAAIR